MKEGTKGVIILRVVPMLAVGVIGLLNFAVDVNTSRQIVTPQHVEK